VAPVHAPAPLVDRQGAVLALTASAAVGGAVAVAELLGDEPVLAAQAVRYAVAAHLLAAVARRRRRRAAIATGGAGVPAGTAGPDRPRPTWREWGLLAALAATGLVLFNVALVQATRHAEPAVVGTVVGCVPLVLAIAGPLVERRAVSRRLVAGALVAIAGAAIVQGAGSADGRGLAWSLVVLACEACFTLLAVPLLPRLGPLELSRRTCVLAAVAMAAGAVLFEADRLALPSAQVAGAIAFLGVVVTAGAFLAWYGAVERLGPATAGLFVAVTPVSAALVGAAIGAAPLRPGVAVGVVLVAAGLAVGLSRPAAGQRARTTSAAASAASSSVRSMIPSVWASPQNSTS
jgi:drug/metabolite transporter (DMT)-like permease